MSFLCPKERLVDFILTQHGRKLLTQGKLKVKYWRAFDDEVDYQTVISTTGST